MKESGFIVSSCNCYENLSEFKMELISLEANDWNVFWIPISSPKRAALWFPGQNLKTLQEVDLQSELNIDSLQDET